jgi:iron complex transport system substrate-binding protein
MRGVIFLWLVCCLLSCKQPGSNNEKSTPADPQSVAAVISHAEGFSLKKFESGITIITVHSPWPNSESTFRYALVPKGIALGSNLNAGDYDAVISIPIDKLVVTSTTHIPALEALGVEDRLVGFPGTAYISSKNTRSRIEDGKIINLGTNESMNTELVLSIQPDLVVGFGITSENKGYETLKRSKIPVVYNGDWTEKNPLGKAEWIKFFAPFFGMEKKADSLFQSIETSYTEVKNLAKSAKQIPTVMSGALYKDVWYAPGGQSWAAEFIRDANADYLWKDTSQTGSLSLSIENVLNEGKSADFWIAPSQFTSYSELQNDTWHYKQFKAYNNKTIYTYALSKGETGGLLYYELGPNRPDLILKDLIHIFHPEVLPDYTPIFFKPLHN